MILPIILGLLGLAALSRKDQRAPSSPSVATGPSRPGTRPAENASPERAAESRALVPLDGAKTSTTSTTSTTAPGKALVPQPKGATGNLLDQTRPLGTSNLDTEQAARLAPLVLQALTTRPREAAPIVQSFQKAADMQQIDGVYGPRTAGALAYYLPPGPGGKPQPIPRPFTPDKRVIPYAV